MSTGKQCDNRKIWEAGYRWIHSRALARVGGGILRPRFLQLEVRRGLRKERAQ